jgi:hypothetical protein
MWLRRGFPAIGVLVIPVVTYIVFSEGVSAGSSNFIRDYGFLSFVSNNCLQFSDQLARQSRAGKYVQLRF